MILEQPEHYFKRSFLTITLEHLRYFILKHVTGYELFMFKYQRKNTDNRLRKTN